MIILCELVDFIKVIRIKYLLSMLKCLSTDSAKNCALSAIVLATLSSWRSVWIVALALRLEKVFDFAPLFAWIAL